MSSVGQREIQTQKRVLAFFEEALGYAYLGHWGVLVADGDHLVFTQDFRFASPSMAAGVVVGGAANGRLASKDERGVTLKALQQGRTEGAP